MTTRPVRLFLSGGLVASMFAALVMTGPPAMAATIAATRNAATATAPFSDTAAGAVTSSSFPVIPPVSANPECSNGQDDDGDGFIDFTPPAGETADPDCSSPGDGVEQADAPTECANGYDDDGDGLIDFTPPAGETADPGCANTSDNNEVDGEANPQAACGNGVDDDGDGLIDFTPPAGETADPGCANTADIDEASEGFPGQVGNPAAVVTSSLAGFPTSGPSFTLLSNGDALLADDPDNSSSSGFSASGDGGGHGASFFDLVTLRVNLTVPAGANCLAFDFKFMSEEFPEYVGSDVNDGFVAELDTSDFSADVANNNAVIAPHNFAFDSAQKVISINTAGFSAAEATGTTYDGSTPTLRASRPVTPGSHSLYLSVFDQGDGIYDSTAFLDNLRIFTAPEGACITGSTADITPPDTTITSGPATGSTTNDNTPTFTFTSTEANSTFQCRVDAAAFAPCTTPFTTTALSDGSHTFEVRAIDSSGNVDPTPASRTFTVSAVVDNQPPDTTITSGPATGSTTNDNTPTFTFTSTEANSTFQCRVDAAAFAPCTTPFTTTALSDGSHTFEVRAIDSSGNVDPTPASRTFTVDTVPPDTTIVSNPGSTTNDSTPTFTFTASDANATFQCSVDGAGFASCSTPFTTTALSQGSHTFQVRASDLSGNTDATPASWTFTVDTAAPDTTITSGPATGSTTNDNTPTFTFTSTEANSTFQCRVDAAAFAPCITPFTTTALSDGSHTFEVRAIDSSGNVDPTPASRTFTVSAVVDNQPPDTTITSGPATGSATNDNTPTFTFTSTEANSTFQCRVDAAAFAPCTTPFTTTALSDGSHTFEVRAIDSSGNVDPTPASRTFTVNTTPPTTCDGKPATIVGTPGDDNLSGTEGADVIVGLGGNDTINGGGGNDTICGGAGNDNIQGGGGDDTIKGDDGNDKIVGGGGDDTLAGGAGDDRINGSSGDDRISGGAGKDQLKGGGGKDKLIGGAGNDTLSGGGGNDTLAGNGGNDHLDGGPGRDSGKGGSGSDVVVRCEI